MIHFIYKSFPL